MGDRAIRTESIEIQSSVFRNTITGNPPAVRGVQVTVVVIHEVCGRIIDLTAPLEGINGGQTAAGGKGPEGGVVIGGGEGAGGGVHELRDVFTEINAVEVELAPGQKSQRAGSCGFRGVPDDDVLNSGLRLHEVYRGDLLVAPVEVAFMFYDGAVFRDLPEPAAAHVVIAAGDDGGPTGEFNGLVKKVIVHGPNACGRLDEGLVPIGVIGGVEWRGSLFRDGGVLVQGIGLVGLCSSILRHGREIFSVKGVFSHIG